MQHTQHSAASRRNRASTSVRSDSRPQRPPTTCTKPSQRALRRTTADRPEGVLSRFAFFPSGFTPHSSTLLSPELPPLMHPQQPHGRRQHPARHPGAWHHTCVMGGRFVRGVGMEEAGAGRAASTEPLMAASNGTADAKPQAGWEAVRQRLPCHRDRGTRMRRRPG